ncbi:S24 family peptidase [Patiriisocius hiemis]|uniref:S24 family peptidase n=1 Tax=Patiriisocius hiemis TaxID=3075604 RepID=A0ABU2YAM1_9FLAO|nr:S24 family peptidase [Constantimarinum sp. W242]MDT0555057.1 S24 family peptidase [Constantimarinum sp. W242]
MEIQIHGKIQPSANRHAPEVSKQTGFPSAATHYMEAPIDLNKELVLTKDATFFVRITTNDWKQFTVFKEDVLLVDRSVMPRKGSLVLAIKEGAFVLLTISKELQEEITVWGVVSYVIHKK